VTLFCYVSLHVICISERVAEVIQLYVRYFVLLQGILQENGCPLNMAMVSSVTGCSVVWHHTSKHSEFMYIHLSASIKYPAFGFLCSWGRGFVISIILKYEQRIIPCDNKCV
jgi:hypothetical protein